VGRQWLGRYGKTDNGVVTVTTVWADERVYYPVHAVPYTPARHFAKGKYDPGVPDQARDRGGAGGRRPGGGLAFRAVAADSAHGDQGGFRAELAEAGLPLAPQCRTCGYGRPAAGAACWLRGDLELARQWPHEPVLLGCLGIR
jgi:hypothetical protein